MCSKYGRTYAVPAAIMQRKAVRKSHRMHRPTDNLRADHELATLGVRVLAALSEWVAAGEEFPAKDCAAALSLLREGVRGVHMRKEDEVMAPAVAMLADEDAAAIVGELLRLREEIVALTHSLVLFWEPMGDLTTSESTGFAETVHALVARLRRRQQLEEDSLFPACDANVPGDDQLQWLEQFAQLEAERSSRAVWKRRIDVLAARWLN